MAYLDFDRYHATMGNFSLTEHAKIHHSLLAEKLATFYVTQRKLRFAPCVGHERLLESMVTRQLDIPRLRFMRQDKAGLSLLAGRMDASMPSFVIRTMAPGTIVFANEPFADIEGSFAETQMMEVKFEHAFDEPMTVAGNALSMRLAAGNRSLSDFSLRRDGDMHRAVEVAKYSVIGGFDDTSNMEAAFLLDLNAVGTMAHYLVQAFIENYYYPEKDGGCRKHFQQTAFERWLDAHPNGTTLLLDTISVRLGTIHAIRAAQSSEKRRNALKAVRIDSGDLVLQAQWVRRMLDANGLANVCIIITSDLNTKKIKEIVERCPFVYGFGVGTKLAAEVENVAGVIFKLCSIEGIPVLKCSETRGKETLPGKLQVWRCVGEDGYYVKDVVSLQGDDRPAGAGIKYSFQLLHAFWGIHNNTRIPPIKKQREFVLEQARLFRDIETYPVELSEGLQKLREDIVWKMREDEMGERGVEIV